MIFYNLSGGMSLRRPAVLRLFFASSPATIVRLIISVVVDTFKGMLRRRSASNIRKEGLKRFKPSNTNADASATVILKILATFAVTSGDHIASRGVFWRWLSSRLTSVLFAFDGGELRLAAFATNTTARPGGPAGHVVSRNNRRVATIAFALKQWDFDTAFRKSFADMRHDK